MKRIRRTVFAVAAAATALSAGGTLLPSVYHATTSSCKSDKIYIDRHQRLMWQDAPYGDAEEDAYWRGKSYGKVGNAAYAKRYCENLIYGGYHDWRLPTSDELMQLYRSQYQALHYPKEGDFWSSTPTQHRQRFVVYSIDAYRYKRNPRKSYYIRCVRCIEPR